ncbi:hypothetical protein [Aquimarina sp. 2201CG14-23]|uniref:hypothetical protein n=1 Tax=Aquimarina mycalae TaxID=3040073 RepID=UPI002477F590|nr:hypothetical protein [Aquimarina sp. 2201CG14-23]MDH7445717.1 hypothetical protein [Aquimarina sp. 2201CG14-23]
MEYLKIETNIFKLKSMEQKYAPIWIEIKGEKFPENNWYDFIYSVLNIWNYSLLEMLKTQKSECVLNFVEGDFAFKFEKKQGFLYYVYLGRLDIYENVFTKKNYYNNEVITINLIEFINELLTTSNDLLKYSELNKISNDDFNTFRIKFLKYKKEIANFVNNPI